MNPVAWPSRLRAAVFARPNNAAASRTREFIKTLVIVVPLTLLIWVYAERAQNGDDIVETQVEFTTTDPNLSATMADGGNGRTSIFINGSHGQIDQLQSKIKSAAVDGRLHVVLPAVDATAGEKPIDLTRLFNDNPLFATSGVTVMKTSPAEATVRVDPLISREVTVVLPRDLPVTLTSYRFDPSRVTVRGPAPALNTQFGGASATIAVDVSTLSTAATGSEQSQDVPLVEPRDSRVKLNVPKVRMTFEIGSTIGKGQIRSVFIDVRRPASEDGASRVVIRKGAVIQNVQITGPENLVRRLAGDRPEASVKAVLKVTQDDVGKGEITRDVEFPDLENGVTTTGGPYTVTFEVTEVAGGNNR